jgi:hypothetical protein
MHHEVLLNYFFFLIYCYHHPNNTCFMMLYAGDSYILSLYFTCIHFHHIRQLLYLLTHYIHVLKYRILLVKQFIANSKLTLKNHSEGIKCVLALFN